MRIHIKLPQRKTMITVHDMLYHLISIHLTNHFDDKKIISKWLSNQLYQRLGNLPRRSGKSENLAKYAVEEILKEIIRPEITEKYNQLNYD